jgi:8-oxo-dGTP pyrophosphatase MutT (NUDIX family)
VAWQRTAVRGIVLTPDGRLLLQQGQDPLDPDQPPYWFLPGGGIDRDETPAEALRRELLEECGLREMEVGHVLWEQHAVFRFAGIDFDQHEHVVLVRVPDAVDIRPTALEALEALAFRDARWWPLDEVSTTGDVIYPLDLAARLREAGLLGVPRGG